MRRISIFGLIIISALLLSYYLAVGSSKGDVFTGYLVEGKPVKVQNGLVLADRDCTPSEDYMELTCTAVIDAGGEVLKVRYTHPTEVPCLSKGDRVSIAVKGGSAVEIVRMGAPSMEH
ncbi:hypothetical protein JCM16138_10760 [Thermococcus atlanticus]